MLTEVDAPDCSSHYPAWRAEYPEAASRFVPGGFGENFVTAHMNERNLCIGDIVSRKPTSPPFCHPVWLSILSSLSSATGHNGCGGRRVAPFSLLPPF